MKKMLIACSIGLASLTLLGGCTQMPTETQGISDLRPRISFKTQSDGFREARVLVDGLDMGSVGDYLAGAAALRVLPGNHTLRVAAGNQVVLEEKFFVSDGAERTFLIK